MSKTYFTLSKKEMEVMELFWDAGCPLARSEILERAAQRPCTWKPNSVHILINSLMDKGALQVAGFYLDSRKLGRTFEPTMTPDDYRLMQVEYIIHSSIEQGTPLENIRDAALRALTVPPAGQSKSVRHT